MHEINALLARGRRMLARHPALYWVFVALLTAAVVVAIQAELASVTAARNAWRSSRQVFVVSRDLQPGDLLASAVESRTVPDAVVPAAAIDDVPVTATARQLLSAGEIVVEADIVASEGPLGLLPEGWLSIPVAGDGAGYRPGDAGAILADGDLIAPNAVVLAVDGDRILVGVPAANAPAVAEAAVRGSAVVALSASRR